MSFSNLKKLSCRSRPMGFAAISRSNSRGTAKGSVGSKRGVRVVSEENSSAPFSMRDQRIFRRTISNQLIKPAHLGIEHDNRDCHLEKLSIL
jgi:hypothetical protein